MRTNPNDEMEPEPESDETIFDNAVALGDATARQEYLSAACGGDHDQRGRIEGLIRAHEGAEGVDFLTSGREGEKRGGGDRASPVAGKMTTAERPGDTIGPFELLKQIGQGGMGTVWLAGQSEPIRREVALKIINPGVDSEAVAARFQTERRALAMMEHPHIARFLDAGVSSAGRPYFAMEFVKGLEITTFCDRKILTVAQRLRLMVQVCRAVQHAHQKGVLHRDLKPSNILVTSQDGKPVPKVIDFGIAKALTEDAGHLGRTVAKQFLGTPAYMSPEQAGIARDIDARADIFSLGAVLYELLTGSPPISPEQLKGCSFEQVVRLVHEAEAPPPPRRLVEQGEALHDVAIHRRTEPGSLARALRGDLEWITGKALSKERGRRYDSAEEFARDIERHLADEPVIAGPPDRIYRARKFIRKYRGVVVAGSSAAAALVIAFTTSAFMYARAEIALHRQSVATQGVADERRAKAQAQMEAEGLLSFAFEDLKAQLEPQGQLQVLGDFVDPAAEHFSSMPAGESLDDSALKKQRMLLVFGDIRRDQGRPAEAASFYADALALKPAEPAVESELEWMDGHLQAELSLGRLHHQGERWNEAYRHFEAALTRLPELPDSDTRKAAILREMAENRRAAGELDAAIALCDREGELRRSLRIRSSSDPTPLHLLAEAQIFSARVHLQAGKLKQAEALLQAAVETLSEMIVGPSVDDTWRHAFIEASTLLGNILQRDRPEAALDRYVAARLVLESSNDTGIDRESRLAEISLNIGRLHEAGNRATPAEIAYYTSLKHFEAAAGLQPTMISFVAGQAANHLALARIRKAQGRDVTESCQTGIALTNRLLNQESGNAATRQRQEMLGEFRKLMAPRTGAGADTGGEEQ